MALSNTLIFLYKYLNNKMIAKLHKIYWDYTVYRTNNPINPLTLIDWHNTIKK